MIPGENHAFTRPLGIATAGEEPHKEILVVDDVPEILDFFMGLSRRFRSLQVRVMTENDSGRALEVVKSTPFDLIVSDFRMRQVDGIEVLKAARQSHPRGYRILMTGYNEIPTEIGRIRDAEVDAYIQKPLKSHDLLLLLLDFLNDNAKIISACRSHARELEQLALREEGAFGIV